MYKLTRCSYALTRNPKLLNMRKSTCVTCQNSSLSTFQSYYLSLSDSRPVHLLQDTLIQFHDFTGKKSFSPFVNKHHKTSFFIF